MYETKILRLRALELSDIDLISEKFNNFKNRQYLRIRGPVSRLDIENWIKKSWNSRANNQGHEFAIELLENKKMIGTTGLSSVNHYNRTAVFGIVIYDEDNWGSGFGSEALQLVMSFGFDLLNLNSIQLSTYEFNSRSMQSYLKNGFKKTGVKRQARYSHGQYFDEILFDIIRDEYYEMINKNPDNFARVELTALKGKR